MSLFRKKTLAELLKVSADNVGLKRTLNVWNLMALGIGAIIGAGLFVRTAAAAGGHAGPAVTLSFVIAAIGCAFAGLCYAEFASIIPVAGSAYTYSYATMGEIVAWIIGWALIMEYALGAVTVSIAWSEYLNNFFDGKIPYEWCHSPFQSNIIAGVMHHGIMNVPALFFLTLITFVLIRGTAESAVINAIIVFVKVCIVLLFIAIGWHFIVPQNHTPYFIPSDFSSITLGNGEPYSYAPAFNHGWLGVLKGAAIVFFAFIGFDAVSTAAQEAKNPKRDMPWGILGSLAICTVLYVLFSFVLTGVAPFTEFMKDGAEASVSFAIEKHMPGFHWLATFVNIAILAGFTSVSLVMLLGQSRVFYSMSNDGLLPKIFSVLHPKYRTPYKNNLIVLALVGSIAAFLPGHLAGSLTSFGTLLAFVVVCIGIWILRKSSPQLERPFKTPLVPFVPIMGILVCGAMIASLGGQTLIPAFIWMLLGIGVYFIYGRKRSLLNKK